MNSNEQLPAGTSISELLRMIEERKLYQEKLRAFESEPTRMMAEQGTQPAGTINIAWSEATIQDERVVVQVQQQLPTVLSFIEKMIEASEDVD